MNSNGKQISFLNKLLEFSNIDQDNLHKIFQDILNRIKHSILLEKKKDSVKKLLKHVKVSGMIIKLCFLIMILIVWIRDVNIKHNLRIMKN